MMERVCVPMEIEIQITSQPIAANDRWPEKFSGTSGAVAEFSGIVRDLENGEKISALEYEAYSLMAEKEIRRILTTLAEQHTCLAAKVIHRIGIIPVGETAIYLGIASKHRGAAFTVLTEFMNRLKQDVPIWKVRSRPATNPARGSVSRSPSDSPTTSQAAAAHRAALRSLNEALVEISTRCQPLPGVRASLAEAGGRVLRETILADEDFPSSDRSTRDGFAILVDDISETFSVIDTLHAADWKPRQLKAGEAVRVATGASLPCENLRVVMQENVERTGDTLKILRRESDLNIRQRGEEMRAGDTVLAAGTKLNAGALALLATVGCTQPLASPKLRVVHFTTGDEIISPDQKPQPGQIRDSNSILIRALLQKFQCEVKQQHLPENFEESQQLIQTLNFQPSTFNLILVSGGASVGDKDFTRPLLEWLGFEIVFNRTSIRPGAPLIFGLAGGASVPASRVAFGLPGNPLSHFVCFHVFVAAALAKLTGAETPKFIAGTLAAKLEDAPNPRETLWPARCEMRNGKLELTPLRWSSSGDVTALVNTNALIRVPPNQGSLAAGATVEFLPTEF
jgi:molybdopterin molybdotransferase